MDERRVKNACFSTRGVGTLVPSSRVLKLTLGHSASRAWNCWRIRCKANETKIDESDRRNSHWEEAEGGVDEEWPLADRAEGMADGRRG